MSLWQTEFTAGYRRIKRAKGLYFSYAGIIANPKQHPCRTLLAASPLFASDEQLAFWQALQPPGNSRHPETAGSDHAGREVSGVALPAGFSLEPLQRSHPRRPFECGQSEVNDWLHTKALQHQDKRLSATKILLKQDGAIAGFYTLATGQVDFGDLPSKLARKLPRRALPVAILAWLGVSVAYQGQRLGDLLLS